MSFSAFTSALKHKTHSQLTQLIACFWFSFFHKFCFVILNAAFTSTLKLKTQSADTEPVHRR